MVGTAGLLGRKKNGRYKPVGLNRPDIVCYLSEAAVREVYPSFLGWTAVWREFSRRKSRPPFKPWLKEHFGVDLTNTYRIQTVLDRMAVNGHQPGGELTQKINEILSRVPGAGDDDPTRAT